MKTKILFIASLVCGGMIFTSCQKDNSLIDETPFEQIAANQQAPDSPKDVSWSGFNDDQGPIGSDMITNYPDPFKTVTTISYIVKGKVTHVSLVVYKHSSELVTVLVNGYLSPGKYLKNFDASGLPAGKYIAELKIGGVVYREEMTKKPMWEQLDESPVSKR